jgi:hypothetical protein
MNCAKRTFLLLALAGAPALVHASQQGAPRAPARPSVGRETVEGVAANHLALEGDEVGWQIDDSIFPFKPPPGATSVTTFPTGRRAHR